MQTYPSKRNGRNQIQCVRFQSHRQHQHQQLQKQHPNKLFSLIHNLIRFKIHENSKLQAVTYMALCMAIHFAGHEFARAPTSSLFTSKLLGFQSPSALPLAVGCVSPFSVILLNAFQSILEKYGPRRALSQSTIVYSIFLISVAILLKRLGNQGINENSYIMQWPSICDCKGLVKTLLFSLFVYQSANVQFLYTQHWSFLGSILTPQEGKLWFAPIAGVGSIASTVAAANVSRLVERIGLLGLLGFAGLVIGASSAFGDMAYRVARESGFESIHDDDKKSEERNKQPGSKEMVQDDGSRVNFGSMNLFRRVPILRAMFVEVILSQCLSSVLNFQFMVKVKEAIIDDEDRASWTGKCYAWINGISGFMQFFVLPICTQKIPLSWLWIMMPLVMGCLTLMQLYEKQPSLKLVGVTFLSMKTIEYSLRGQVSEMVFASLDYESRFIGKQKINLFANRLGKSAMAVTLFLLATYLDKEDSELNHILVYGSNLIAFIWLISTIHLTRYIDIRKEDESK
mmetsp:Transcript_5122/g.9733  ORF Transcript_5122/g.9733 Transcript_5122/m.9733 type:complete len:513 (-) Transcript_5122:697-2235(-)